MKTFLKRIYNFFASFFRKKNEPIIPVESKAEVIRVSKEKFPLFEKAFRNQNKCFSTTKSFNGKMLPVSFGSNNPEAQLYLKLVERKKRLDEKGAKHRLLRSKSGKVLSFKRWNDQRFRKLRLAV